VLLVEVMLQKQFWMAYMIQSINVVIEKLQLNISFTSATVLLTEEYIQVAQEIIGQKVALAESK
jgi:hypothetical protein